MKFKSKKFNELFDLLGIRIIVYDEAGNKREVEYSNMGIDIKDAWGVHNETN